MERETLHFKIGLSGSNANKQPKFKIKVGEQELVTAYLSRPPGQIEYFEFDVELPPGNSSLDIEFLNKVPGDTIIDNNKIVSDLLLNIDSIEVDEIALGPLLWTASVYCPIYPENYLDEEQKSIKEIRNCVTMGWNGTWSLPFTSPFYIWLLENI